MNDWTKWPKWRDMQGGGRLAVFAFWFFVFMAANEIWLWIK